MPQRLLSAWMRDLSDVELGVMLTLLGEIELHGRSAAPCPMERLALYWESLKRPVSAEEIRAALKHMACLGALQRVAPPESADGAAHEPWYTIAYDWRGTVEED